MNENQNSMIRQNSAYLNFWDVFRVLLRRFVWLAAAGLLGAAITFAVVRFLVTPTYQSRISFYVYNTSDSATYSGTINNNDLQAAESLATTYSKILESNSVRNAVLEKLKETEITRKDLSRMVKVSVIKDTQLLEVVVTSPDAEQANNIANAYATVAPTEIVRITKAGGVEVVDQPEVASEKASPRTVFDTAVGFIIGVIAAAAYIIFKMLSDRTIYLPEDLEPIGVTILGQIPEIVAADGKANGWKTVKAGEISLEKAQSKQKGTD